jgi:hypothetical protein
MADQGDLAAEQEQWLRDQALARRGIVSRVTEIPPPHYGDGTQAPQGGPNPRGER